MLPCPEKIPGRELPVLAVGNQVVCTEGYGWALVRCSNTGPNITARFEADTKENLEKLQNEFTLQITLQIEVDFYRKLQI